MFRRINPCIFALAICLLFSSANAKEPVDTMEVAASSFTSAEMANRVSSTDQLRKSGWIITPPIYPYEAHRAHQSGDIYLEVTTGPEGRVTQVLASKDDKYPLLTKGAARLLRANWRGPASKTIFVKQSYRL